MNKPLVSIIMPTYKRSDLISRAIDSCIKQTYQNIELIIVDDNIPGSIHRKKTEKVLSLYKNENKIRYIKLEKNSGASLARNIGIDLSKGEYITFLDDDDEFLPENIEQEIKFISKNNYDMIFCDVILFNEKMGKKVIKKYRKNFSLNQKDLLRKHLVDIISGGIAFMYKRSVLKELGGFPNLSANQEYMLMFYTILGNYKIGYFEYAGAVGYLHDSSSGITGSISALNAKKEVLDLIKPHLKLLKFKDRRKVLFRLNLFIVIQSIRLHQTNYLSYLLKLFLFIDLLIFKIVDFRKKNAFEDILYV